MRKLLFRKKFLLLACAVLITAAAWNVVRQMPSGVTQKKTAVGSFIATACTLKTWDLFGWRSKDDASPNEVSQASTNAEEKATSATADTIEEVKVPDVKSKAQTASAAARPTSTSTKPSVEQFPLASSKSTAELPPVLVSRPELLLPKYGKPVSPTAVLSEKTGEKAAGKASEKNQPGSPQRAVVAPAKQDAGSVPAKTSGPAPASAKTPAPVPSPSDQAAARSDKSSQGTNVSKQVPTGQAPKRDRLFTKIVDAYTYAYPLVLMNEIQKEMTDSIFFAPVNQMAYMPVLPSPRLRTTECPNVDALTSLVWFDLEQEPQVILLPKAPGHAYVLALLDAWTNVIDSFGQAKAENFPIRQINGHDAKCFVLCGPNCKLKFPADMPVVKSPTNCVWLINRVLLGPPRADGSPDIASTARTLYEFDVVSWGHFVKAISDASRSDAQTRLLHYLNAQSQARYASSPMRMPLTLNTDFSILNGNTFVLSDSTAATKSDSQEAPAPADSKPAQPSAVSSQKPAGVKPAAPAIPSAQQPDKATVPTDKAQVASETKQIDAAAQAVEKNVAEQTQESLQSDAPATQEVELEIDEDIQSSEPTQHVIWQPYRTRLGFVRYAQAVTVPSTPAAEPKKADRKSSGVESRIEGEIREVTDEIKAIPTEISQGMRRAEQKAGAVEKRMKADMKSAEKATDRAARSAKKDAKTDIDDAMSRTEQVSSDLMKYIKGVWLRTKDYSKEGLEYGKDAIDYFHRKAKRDFRHLEQIWAEFADSHKWRQRPETRVNEMTPMEFFTEFAELLKKNPPATADAEITATLKELGITPGESFDVEKIDTKVLQAMQFAVPFARGRLRQSAVYGMFREPEQNNWIVFRNFGRYGTDYLRRAVVANEFMGADIESEILYPFAFFDTDGKLLDGRNDYIVHFPAGSTPPTEVLWSVTLYDSNHYLTSNQWKRYAVRSNMPLVYNPDGSLDIMIQHKMPDLLTSNWLPAPAGPFMLMMRIYRPDASVLSGQWKIPGVTVRVKK
ncbi:MAG: DUF1214 domain-containing protein [Thermoguttaceae bacterium]|nr:DUF1214 domain-containing protein [Thermoguttaceae bacterium]